MKMKRVSDCSLFPGQAHNNRKQRLNNLVGHRGIPFPLRKWSSTWLSDHILRQSWWIWGPASGKSPQSLTAWLLQLWEMGVDDTFLSRLEVGRLASLPTHPALWQRLQNAHQT